MIGFQVANDRFDLHTLLESLFEPGLFAVAMRFFAFFRDGDLLYTPSAVLKLSQAVSRN